MDTVKQRSFLTYRAGVGLRDQDWPIQADPESLAGSCPSDDGIDRIILLDIREELRRIRSETRRERLAQGHTLRQILHLMQVVAEKHYAIVAVPPGAVITSEVPTR